MDDQEEELPVLLGGKSHVEKDKIEASSLALFLSFYVFFVCCGGLSFFWVSSRRAPSAPVRDGVGF